MNFDFLQQPFLGTTLMNYTRMLTILILGALFLRIISKYCSKLIFVFFKKYSDDSSPQTFLVLLLQPIQGLIYTILAYIALNQIDGVLKSIILLSRKGKAGADGGTIITMMNLVDHIFFLTFIFYFALLISRILDFIFKMMVDRAIKRKDRERQQLMPLFRDVLKVILWCIAFFTVLGVVFHVNIPTLIAGMGVGGIAIAFAAKETLENLLASFMVMLDKPFTIGDWIKVDGVEGTVEKVGFRSTRLRTFDKSIIILPNRTLIDGQLENFSERGLRRVKFTVGAVYGLSQKSLETIIASIRQIIKNTEGTVGNELVYLDNFGDSSVNIQVVYYISLNNSNVVFEKVKQHINFGIYQIMYQYGNGFAFPTQVEIKGSDTDQVERSVPGKPA